MPPLDHGPRHAAARVPREDPRLRRRLQDGRPSCARSTRPIPTPSASSTSPSGLEGLRRQDGIHAAAVVITREPLTEYLPIQRKPEPGGDDRGRADRHAVRDARRRGPRPAEDGLPRAAQPRRHRDHARPRRARATGVRPDIDGVAARRRQDVRDAPARRHHRRVPARRRADAALLRSLAPRSSKTSPRWSRCTGRGRWARTCTTTTPTARTAASRSPTTTPTLEEVLGPRTA